MAFDKVENWKRVVLEQDEKLNGKVLIMFDSVDEVNELIDLLADHWLRLSRDIYDVCEKADQDSVPGASEGPDVNDALDRLIGMANFITGSALWNLQHPADPDTEYLDLLY